MASRIFNKNLVRFTDFFHGPGNSSRRCLHVSLKFDKNIQFCLSDIGEGIREVTVKSWHVKVDDKVSQFDNICDVESDKATVKITSRYDGIIKKIYYNVDDTAYVGQPLVDIDVPDDVAEENSQIDDKSLATPAIRKFAAEHSINLNDVKPTGENNRVLKEDILRHMEQLKKSDSTDSRYEIKPVESLMKTMIRVMNESNIIPAFYYSDNIDFTRLVETKTNLAKNDVKITYLPFIVKAISKSLHKFPIINASLDEDLKNIIYKKFHNIGVAVDAKSIGLMVPNIKNVQNLTVMEISNEMKRLQKAAYNGTLTPDEMNNGTFSVSNIGAIDGVIAMPCIIPPQVAILAIGKLEKLPRYNEDNQLVPRHIVRFTFSADHRLLDGATICRFCTTIKNYIENPETLLMEL